MCVIIGQLMQCRCYLMDQVICVERFPAMPFVLVALPVFAITFIVFLSWMIPPSSRTKRQHQLEIANLKKENVNLKEENANLKEEIAKLKDHKAQSHQDEQREQVSRANEVSSERAQRGGEDQRRAPVIHDSSPIVTEGDQPRIQFGTIGMEIEVPSFESEELLVEARVKRYNSEAENKAVDKGLNKKLPRELYSRESSLSSGADLPLVDLSGVVAEGHQPLSSAKDATLTTQIDKKINQVPTGIESIVLSKHDLDLRQLLSDAISAQIIDQLDMKIEPNLDETALSDGRLSKSKFPFSIMLRALQMIILEKPNKSDIDDLKWLDRLHLKKFKEESGRSWLKENLEPSKAEERLNLLKKAAVESLDKAGGDLVWLFKRRAQINKQLHPNIDLDEMISCSKKGMYTFDGVDRGEGVRLLAGALKKKPSS